MNKTPAIVILSLVLSVPVTAEVSEPVKNVIIQHELDLAGVKFTLDVLGQPARVAFRTADETGIVVDAAGAPVLITWDALPPRQLVTVAAKAAVTPEEIVAVVRFAHASGLTDDAARLLDDAAARFPAGAAQLAALKKELFPVAVMPPKPPRTTSEPPPALQEPPFISTTPGPGGSLPLDILPDPSTLHSISLRWPVRGDENSNASITVDYRKKRDTLWRKALPLFRCETAALIDKPPDGASLFAGSVLNLDPGTAYEVRLRLTDPDGGNVERIVPLETWKEPFPPEPLRVFHVVPGSGGGSGSLDNPFRGLAAAEAASRPGDHLLLHKGIYNGQLVLTKSGKPDAPIVWRGAGDGEAVIDAGRRERGISASDIKHVFFEDLTVRNAVWGLVAHRGAYVTIRRVKFEQVEYGIAAHAEKGGQERFFISDCVMQGPSVWPREKGIENARGIQISGVGSDICYNSIRGFADAIDTFGAPPVRAIDIHHNDISVMTDDGIETDYSEQNVRCFMNRCTNVFQGISLQPVHAGPVYVFRNAVFSVEAEPYKLHNNPSGGLVMHNTTVTSGMPFRVYAARSTVSNMFYRNNLFVGAVSGGNYVMELSPVMKDCDFDYNAYVGGPFPRFAKWSEAKVFGSFQDFVRGTGQEKHGIYSLVFDGIFAAVKLPVHSARAQEFPMTANDLRLAPTAPVIDKGVVLPNVNDGFSGAAPDIGCFELDAPLPHYGPRPLPGQ